MKRVLAAALAAAAGGILACAAPGGRPRAGEPEPGLRIWAPTLVRWSPGSGREVRFAIENGTQRTLELPAPDPDGARVAIFADAEAPACAVEPSAAAPGETVRLAPGDQVALRIDLGRACGALRPGEYRYELSYRAPRRGGGALSLPTWYGTLLVDGPPRAERRAGVPVLGPAGPRDR
jgi:hypothetical protein